MDLFLREFGPVGAPTIVFLHGGRSSGWSWEPVVQRLPQYRALVPDLPQYGQSSQQGPFEIDRAADAVAALIRSRAGSARVHLVGFSLGAQVGLQLLATEPDLVDRALLCGTVVNRLPGVRVTQLLLGLLARTPAFRRVVNRLWSSREAQVGPAGSTDHREDIGQFNGAQLADIVMASAGFTAPAGLRRSTAPTLFITGAKERRPLHRLASALAQTMPDAIDRVALGMGHEWPLQHPALFARTVDGWLSGSTLPDDIGVPDAHRVSSANRRPASAREPGGPPRDKSRR